MELNQKRVADGFDLALRGRAPPDSGLVARHLMDAQLVVVAAPAYLARAGTPRTLEELAQHDCIQFVLPSTGMAVPWIFMRDGHELEMATQGSARVSEDLLGVATLARAGGGVVQTYQFMVEDDVRSGALVEVLQSFGGRSRPFHLLYPRNRHLPLRVRVFVDFLVQALKRA